MRPSTAAFLVEPSVRPADAALARNHGPTQA
jgi:hypothetical protein